MFTYAAGSPGTFAGPRDVDARGPGYGAYGAEAAAPTAEAKSAGWLDAVSAILTTGVTLYSLDAAKDAETRARHERERQAAAEREAAVAAARVQANQAALVSAGVPLTVAAAGGGLPWGMLLVVGGAAAALGFVLLRRRRR